MYIYIYIYIYIYLGWFKMIPSPGSLLTWFEGWVYHSINVLKTPIKMFMAMGGSRINKLILIDPRSRKCSTTAPRCFFFRGWTSPRPCWRPPCCWPARGAMDGNHGVGHGNHRESERGVIRTTVVTMNGSGNWKRAPWYFQETSGDPFQLFQWVWRRETITLFLAANLLFHSFWDGSIPNHLQAWYCIWSAHPSIFQTFPAHFSYMNSGKVGPLDASQGAKPQGGQSIVSGKNYRTPTSLIVKHHVFHGQLPLRSIRNPIFLLDQSGKPIQWPERNLVWLALALFILGPLSGMVGAKTLNHSLVSAAWWSKDVFPQTACPH